MKFDPYFLAAVAMESGFDQTTFFFADGHWIWLLLLFIDITVKSL